MPTIDLTDEELEHRAAEIDTLKAQLAGAEGRAAAESAQAFAAFESLAQRLEAMAVQRAIKPGRMKPRSKSDP